jgi:hypothetical protein
MSHANIPADRDPRPRFSRLKLFYLLHLSQPSAQRVVYRSIRRQKARKIVELGIGTAQRAVRMIQVASALTLPGEIHYTGIDPFEGRSEADGAGLSLREAHRLLQATGAHIRLVPGTPEDGLARVANALREVDLLLLSPRPDPECLGRAWFYIPRLLGPCTLVLLEGVSPDGRVTLRRVDAAEIRQRAAVPSRRAA